MYQLVLLSQVISKDVCQLILGNSTQTSETKLACIQPVNQQDVKT